MLGSLTNPADAATLIGWIDNALSAQSVSGILLCLDSLLYGGLVNSRRCDTSLKQVLERCHSLVRWRKKTGPATPIYGQSSIMRISDNYDATEEKPYWARYGKDIFTWSTYLHRLQRGEKLPSGVLASTEAKIPAEVRKDYLAGRGRNFQVNRQLIEHVKSGDLDFLAFSLDDSGASGLNVLEKDRLALEAEALIAQSKIQTYAGADEVLLALFARWLIAKSLRKPRARVIYSPAPTADCNSRYEGQSVKQTVSAQLQACSIDSVEADQDFIVLVHGRAGQQGDHILLPGEADARSLDTSVEVAQTISTLKTSESPVVLCDVAYANGADPLLVPALLKSPELSAKLWAYAGWNTTGNTVGSALATGVARWFAGQQPDASQNSIAQSLKRCLFVRFADDWAYQAVSRSTLNGPADNQQLQAGLASYLKDISDSLGYLPTRLELRHPWQRTFEIEVAL
jgi:hypothetical protein